MIKQYLWNFYWFWNQRIKPLFFVELISQIMFFLSWNKKVIMTFYITITIFLISWYTTLYLRIIIIFSLHLAIAILSEIIYLSYY